MQQANIVQTATLSIISISGALIGHTFGHPSLGAILLPLLSWALFQAVIWWQLRRFTKEGCERIPGPQPSFPDGNLVELLQAETVPEAFAELSVKYGSPPFLQFFAGPVSQVIISNSDGLKQIMMDKRSSFIKGAVYQATRAYFGDPLFSIEGDLWKTHRHVLNPAFRTENLRNIADKVFPSQASVLVNKWFQQTERGNPVCLFDDTAALTLDIIAEAAFGVKLNALMDEEPSEVFSAFKFVIVKAVNLSLPGASFNYPLHRAYKANVDILNNLVDEVIQKTKKAGFDGQKANLMQLMMESGKLTDAEMRSEVFGFILAGHETTASNISWTTVALSQFPEIQAKVQEELDSVLQGRSPNWDDAHNLPYLKAVVMESHRYYSIAQMLNRECVQDEEVCGYFIPKGATVWFSPHILSRDPNIWENPSEFRPERFIGKELPAHQFASFGAGARMCIGKFFALNEAIIVLAMIFQHFKTSLVDDKVPKKKFTVTLTPSNKVFVKLEQRV